MPLCSIRDRATSATSSSLPMRVRSLLTFAVLAAAARPLAAQRARLAIAPSRPLPGAVVTITVTDSASAADSIVALRGTMSGEPLHFARSRRGFRAIGAVPVDSGATAAAAEVVVERASGRVDTLRAAVEPPPMPPPSEQLSVSSRFGQPFDSATNARVEAESERARAIGRRSHDVPQLWHLPFQRPRASAVTSQFGTGRTFNGQVTSRHLGVDFKGATGDPVLAANRGVVALVDTTVLGGRVVYVDHGGGIVTAYMHLSRPLVAAGDTVRRGQRIGLVGATGRVTGPHLHWGAR